MMRCVGLGAVALMWVAAACAQDQPQLPPGYGAWQGELPGVASANPPPNGANIVHSGTGFFVGNQGYLLTNEHVVHGCSRVMVRGSVPTMEADVVATDPVRDLALVKADARPLRVASFREGDDRLFVNDPVLVIGYPLERGVTGQYKVARSTVVALEGPQKEPHWLQFADSAMQGNSGGPLLDSSGNVIGVIVGKTKLMRMNPLTREQEVVSQSDVAISLAYVKKFLHQNQVPFRYAGSSAFYSLERVENMAKEYIVNIHCKVQPM